MRAPSAPLLRTLRAVVNDYSWSSRSSSSLLPHLYHDCYYHHHHHSRATHDISQNPRGLSTYAPLRNSTSSNPNRTGSDAVTAKPPSSRAIQPAANSSNKGSSSGSGGSGEAESFGAPRTPDLAPRTRDRGPRSKEETQTDFGTLDLLGSMPPPATAIDACLPAAFHLSNGVRVTGGAGVLLVGGEAFAWRPWEAIAGTADPPAAAAAAAADVTKRRMRAMVNKKFQWELPAQAWGVLDLVWPKPELLIVGMGGSLYPLAPETRKAINDLGIRVDILDTRNAAAQFNLLATERGVSTVAAALLPVGWRI